MKQTILYLLIIVIFSTTCVEVPKFTAVKTGTISNISASRASVSGEIVDIGEGISAYGHCCSSTSGPTLEQNEVKTNLGSKAGKGEFVSNLSGLKPSTTYYIRAYATGSDGAVYGSEITFTTQSYEAPTVETTAISAITQISAVSGGNVLSDGNSTVPERGVCWGVAPNPEVTGNRTIDGGGQGNFTSLITGLQANSTYYVRAYATNIAGTSYGTETSFKTLAGKPIVNTTEISAITSSTATGGGEVISDGGSPVTFRGVCWKTSTNPTIKDSKTSDGDGSGTFVSSLTGLAFNTVYYVRAYAINSIDTAYGPEISFVTAPTVPTVTTSAISSITATTATGGGNVTKDGGATIAARGVCWSTSPGPTIENSKTYDGAATGSFTSSITELSGGTTYYIRAYATNSAGTGYGTEVSFMTKAVAPTITTADISSITTSSASGGGNVTNEGGANVTARGICWNTATNPTISHSKTNDGTGAGAFTSTMAGLAGGTKYYVRAYATNSGGTSYGPEVTFTTLPVLPTITTTAISNLTTTSASSGGNVTKDGGATVTVRGVCWGIANNPTTGDNYTTDGSGTGTFASSITGLTSGVTYYVRAYATNSEGTAYGNQISFIAPVQTMAIQTKDITGITAISATSGGIFTNTGTTTISAKGICWSDYPNPTLGDKIQTAGTGTSNFDAALSILIPNKTYYVRAYATNTLGTVYGEQKTLTTNDAFYEGFESGFSSGSTGSWGIITGDAVEGAFSLSTSQSGATATISRILLNAGQIMFWSKNNTCAGCPSSTISFYIDNVLQGTENNVNWLQKSYPVSAGNHTFKWVFSRSVYGGVGWIDFIIMPN
jgi:hypothetical protein